MTLPFYPFYWGDYSAKTFDLTQGQHGAYMLLLRYVYTSGDPIPHGQRYSIAKALLPNERENTDYILEKFFTKKGEIWRSLRCEEVMKDADKKHQRRVIAGKKLKKQCLSNAKAKPKQPEPQPEPQPIVRRKKDTTYLSKEKRGTRLPDNFEPDESCHRLADALLLSTWETQAAFDNFMDYWRAVPGAKGLKLDWQMTFKNQLRHAAKQKGKTHGKNSSNTIKGGLDLIKSALIERRNRESDVFNGDSQPDSQDVPRLLKIAS